ncbi:MAG: A24 family peptidase [Oligoflexales bacterium]
MWMWRPVGVIEVSMFLTGLLLGSFFNVCIYRVPREEFFASARSRCPRCFEMIPFWWNIPVLSYLVLKGKSNCCQKPISIRYPLVEILTACLFVVAYRSFPFLYTLSEPWVFQPLQCLRWAHALFLMCFLFVCSVIDLEHMIIPDVFSLPMLAMTPLAVWLHPELSWHSSLAGIIAGWAMVTIPSWLYLILRKQEGMGMGDAKLLAVIGGWLGVESVFPTMFFGSILGSFVGVSWMIVTRKMDMKLAIPFGPFLSLGAVTHLLGGAALSRWIWP